MPSTIPLIFFDTVNKYPNETALAFKSNGTWFSHSWTQHGDEVKQFARGLICLGLKKNDAVTILSQNRREWIVADLGVILAGGTPAGIYPSSSPDQCAYIIDHCKSAYIVVENRSQLEKIISIKENTPSLKGIILLEGSEASSFVHNWDAVIKLGKAYEGSDLEERIEAQKESDLATLVYTSGTTAHPKAVMLSHKNLLWTAKTVNQKHLNLTKNDVFVSYLPLSHIAEQMLSIHSAISAGYQVHFAESIEKLGENLKEIRPTIFFGVPRVWEKIQAKMVEKASENSPIKKKIAKWAKGIGLAHSYESQYQRQKSKWQFHLADKIVFSKVKKALGLDRCRLQVTGAAPIATDTLDFFASLNIPLYEIFGMSECSGPTTISLPDGSFRIGKVGLPIDGTEIKIASDGEILIKGPHIFMGYLHDEKASHETLDADGYLHSGDLGAKDQDGFVSIAGRKKNLIITAGGENISTEMVENKFNAIKGVEHVVALGDQQKYLSLLITLEENTAIKQSEVLGSHARNVSDIASCPKFHSYLSSEIERINRSVAKVQTIKKFKVLKDAFTEETGELTPTMKVKRNVILNKFKPEINELFT